MALTLREKKKIIKKGNSIGSELDKLSGRLDDLMMEIEDEFMDTESKDKRYKRKVKQ